MDTKAEKNEVTRIKVTVPTKPGKPGATAKPEIKKETVKPGMIVEGPEYEDPILQIDDSDETNETMATNEGTEQTDLAEEPREVVMAGGEDELPAESPEVKDRVDLEASEDTPQDSETSGGTEKLDIDLALISDSTAVCDIEILRENLPAVIGDESGAFESAKDLLDELSSGETLTPERIGQSVAILRRCNAAFFRAEGIYSSMSVHAAYTMGEVLNKLKPIVKQHGNWEDWTGEHLKFMCQKTVSNYMGLASRPDLKNLATLGLDRLIRLKGVIGKTEVDGFLRRYGLPTGIPENKEQLDQFRLKTDAALAVEKFKKAGAEIDLETAMELIESGIPIRKGLITRYSDIQESEGDTKKFVQKILDKESDEAPPKEENLVETVPKELKKMKKRLQRLETITGNAEIVEVLKKKIKRDVLDILEGKILRLKQLLAA